jgi:hypothetical protein
MFFLLPMVVTGALGCLCRWLPSRYKIKEMSSNAGGLIRWPVKVAAADRLYAARPAGHFRTDQARSPSSAGLIDDPNQQGQRPDGLKKNWPPPLLPPKPRRHK